MLSQIAEQIEERGLQQGLQQGMQQGLQQGMHKKATENAGKMKLKGYPIKEIADITGLSAEEIESL